MITIMIMLFTEKVKPKRGECLFSNANNLPGKDPAVRINDFERVGLELLLLKKSHCYILEESRIWRGRKGKWPTGACPLYYLSFFSISSLFFSVFFLIFSSVLLLCFFFFFITPRILCFLVLFSGHDQGPFIDRRASCRERVFNWV